MISLREAWSLYGKTFLELRGEPWWLEAAVGGCFILSNPDGYHRVFSSIGGERIWRAYGSRMGT